MERKQVLHYRVVVVGLLVVIVSVLAGFAAASAVVSNSDGTINACYKNSNGNLHLNVKGCKAGKETAVTLSGSTPIFARVAADGTLGVSKHVVSVTKGPPGVYDVTFDRNVDSCAVNATPNSGFHSAVASHSGTVLVVGMFLSDTATVDDAPFDVSVIC